MGLFGTPTASLIPAQGIALSLMHRILNASQARNVQHSWNADFMYNASERALRACAVGPPAGSKWLAVLNGKALLLPSPPKHGKIMHALQAPPDGLWAGVAVALAVEMPPELADEIDHWAQGRLVFLRPFSAQDHDDGFPFARLKDDAAGQFGASALAMTTHTVMGFNFLPGRNGGCSWTWQARISKTASRAVRKLTGRLPLTFLHCFLARIRRVMVPSTGAGWTWAWSLRRSSASVPCGGSRQRSWLERIIQSATGWWRRRRCAYSSNTS